MPHWTKQGPYLVHHIRGYAPYEVDPLHHPGPNWSWLQHLSNKPWATPEILGELAEKLARYRA